MVIYDSVQHIRGFMTMHYITVHFTCLLVLDRTVQK